MKCPFCFQEISNDAKKCPICEKEIPEAPVSAEIMVDDGANEVVASVPDDAELIREEPVKRGKARKILLCVIGLLLVLGAALFCLKDAIVGFCLRNFSDPVTYFSYVEGKEFSDGAEDWFEKNAKQKKEFKEFGYIANTKLKIADDIGSLFADLDEDLEDILYWLDGFGMTVDGDYKDGNFSTKMSWSAQGEELLRVVSILKDNGEIYVSVPNLSSKYLQLTEVQEDAVNFSEILPEDAVLEKMVNRYYKILFENLTDVTGGEGVYTRNDGVEEEAYVLTVRVTEKQLHDIFSRLVAEAKEDAQLKKLYTDFTSAYVKAGLLEKEDVESWDDLIQDAEDFLAEAKEELDGEGEELFVLTDYVNSKHEIMGRKITTAQEESFLLSYYKDKRDIDFVLTLEDFVIRAAGEVVDDHASVTGKVMYDEMQILDLKLNWGDEDLMVRLDLADEARETIVEQLGGAANLGKFYNYLDLGIQFEMDTDDDVLEAEFSVLVSDKEKITLTTAAQMGAAEKIELPAETDVYSMEDMEKWAETMDLHKLYNALEKSGFPVDII